MASNIQPGNYKRPGIFTEEFDTPIDTTLPVQGIQNIVIGVSKKGPINTAVLLNSVGDLQNNYGNIDRNAERKGSFFHRTIAKMLESGPVWAVNLLATDDTLDTLEYAPISTSTDKTNDIIHTGAYRRFFNNVGFWKKDTDSFLTLASTNIDYTDRLLYFTNMSSNYITTFIFKSTMTGFDITMLNWYGTAEKIPPYLYPTDYASDYMVDVVVLAGDWSNYNSLSVDSKWSKYFDTTGLRKDQVLNFVNDPNVTLLKYFQGLSLIPYFKNPAGQNIFIETVINQFTNSTGLFCAFNIDELESEFPNGKIDLIGNNLITNDSLIDSNNSSINFLSYNDTITESLSFTNTILDYPGNVISLDSTNTYRSNSLSNLHRTDWYAEDIVIGLTRGTPTVNSASASITFNYNNSTVNGTDVIPYAIIGGNKINIAGSASFNVLATDYPNDTNTKNYYVTYKLDTSGNITKVTSTTPDTKPSVATTDIVLGYMFLSGSNSQFGTMSYTDINVGTASYLDISISADWLISYGINNTFDIIFEDTASIPSVSNYEQYRRIKRFNQLRSILESVNIINTTILVDMSDGKGTVKYPLKDAVITSVTSTTSNKSINVDLGVSTNVRNTIVNSLVNNGIILYVNDNEQIFSDYKLTTVNTISSTDIGTSSYGVIGKNSEIYKSYYAGDINSGDYFYGNVSSYTINTVTFATNGGNPYIIFGGTSSGAPFDVEVHNSISIPDSVLNTGVYTFNGNVNYAHSVFGLSASYNYGYKVNQAITAEILTSVSTVYDTANKYYLSMFIDGSDNLTVNITDNTLSANDRMGTLLNYNQTINILSNKTNYQESVDIELPDGYTQVPNKVLIKATRYPNIKLGDFLEAYVDVDLLVDGQVGKRLTRIINKKVYASDTTLVELTCDTRIYTAKYGSRYQTMRYSTLDNYVSTYKAIPLKGFRLRQASQPDGTEARQNTILDLVSKGTPLFKAITNKNALDFRYLVDSFGLGLINKSKQQLVDICGERLDCIGFINAPSIKQFKNNGSPSFVNTEGVIQASYIATGGNLDNNPAFLYSFGEGKGVSCVGYFLPYLTTSDNGRPIEVPPAMYVASTYMRKHNSGLTTKLPWTIAAGITDGVIIGISGIEMAFTDDDLDLLIPAQFNPIVIKRNNGYIIDSENTALVLYKSSLSYLHVREVLIELEKELSAMLLTYNWKFNTPDIRSNIKLSADSICKKYVTKKGLYNFYNVCDATNNTQDLIDNQIGVLSTYCEVIKGLEVIVNQVTVLKTGGIQSTGFITA